MDFLAELTELTEFAARALRAFLVILRRSFFAAEDLDRDMMISRGRYTSPQKTIDKENVDENKRVTTLVRKEKKKKRDTAWETNNGIQGTTNILLIMRHSINIWWLKLVEVEVEFKNGN